MRLVFMGTPEWAMPSLKAMVESGHKVAGVLTQPDHTSYPAALSLQSNTPSFYTETVVSGYQRTYLTLFNLSKEAEEYTLGLGSMLGPNDSVVFDCNPDALVSERVIRGRPGLGEGRYVIVVPLVDGLHLLGFPDNYMTLSGRQVKGISAAASTVIIDPDLPPGSSYTFVALGADGLLATGSGISVAGVETRGAMTRVDFEVEARSRSLILRS